MWKNITPAQIVQRKQIEIERQYWDELKTLHDTNDILNFWRKYCEYLEKMNLISPNRRLIYNAAQKTIKKIKK